MGALPSQLHPVLVEVIRYKDHLVLLAQEAIVARLYVESVDIPYGRAEPIVAHEDGIHALVRRADTCELLMPERAGAGMEHQEHRRQQQQECRQRPVADRDRTHTPSGPLVDARHRRSYSLGIVRYSPKCVEGEFCELRRHGVLGSTHVLTAACVSSGPIREYPS